MSSHVCDRKCKGEKFNGLYIRCVECGEISRMECLFTFKTAKLLMQSFALYDEIKNSFINDSARILNLKSVFRKESPFAFVCFHCKEETTKIHDELLQTRKKLEEVEKQLIASKNKAQMDSADDIISVGNENLQNVPESFDIFVPHFPPSTECDAISALIVAETGLDADSFTVSKMIGPKKNIKYVKLMNFRIKTSNKETYDVILNNKTWAPLNTAVPFNVNARTEAKQRKEQRQKQKQKSNQLQKCQ